MVFISKNEEDLSMIPSSYVVFSFSRGITPSGDSCNIMQLPNELLPDIDYGKDIETRKENYKNKLKIRKTLVAYIAKNAFNDASNSIVFYCDPKEKERLGYNPVKIFVKFLKKEYGIVSFKFTNCVTRAMRNEAHLSEHQKQKIIADCIKVHEIITNG